MHWMCCKLLIKSFVRPCLSSQVHGVSAMPCSSSLFQHKQQASFTHKQTESWTNGEGKKKSRCMLCFEWKRINLTDAGSEKQRVWAVIRGEWVFLELKLIYIYSHLLLLKVGNQCHCLFITNRPRGPWRLSLGEVEVWLSSAVLLQLDI